jgi:hypothetical protein
MVRAEARVTHSALPTTPTVHVTPDHRRTGRSVHACESAARPDNTASAEVDASSPRFQPFQLERCLPSALPRRGSDLECAGLVDRADVTLREVVRRRQASDRDQFSRCAHSWFHVAVDEQAPAGSRFPFLPTDSRASVRTHRTAAHLVQPRAWARSKVGRPVWTAAGGRLHRARGRALRGAVAVAGDGRRRGGSVAPPHCAAADHRREPWPPGLLGMSTATRLG